MKLSNGTEVIKTTEISRVIDEFSLPDGVYRVRPSQSTEAGVQVARNDTDGTVVLLQRLTDNFGRVVDFKNTILIMTSNIGVAATIDHASLGFKTPVDEPAREGRLSIIRDELEEHFRPAFLNRLDAVVMFDFLDDKALRLILNLELQKVRGRLDSRKIKLDIDQEAVDHFIDFGYSEKSGARGIRRILEERIEDPLSELIVTGEVHSGDTALVSVQDSRIHISVGARET